MCMSLLVKKFFVMWTVTAFPHARSSQWPIPTSATMPNVELSLAPPAQPFPEVLAEVGSLSKAREAFTHVQMDRLQDMFSGALAKAQTRIGEHVGRAMLAFDDPALLKAMATPGSSARANSSKRPPARYSASFLNLHAAPEALPIKMSVKINVIPSAPLDLVVKHQIDVLESKRAETERGFFEQVQAETQSLSDLVMRELESQIGHHLDSLLGRAGIVLQVGRVAGFTGISQNRGDGIPEQANVRVVASDVPYPTVSSLVQDMETRRDTSENLERAKIVKMQLELLKAENAVAKDALSHSVTRILAQYMSLNQNVRE